MRVAGVQLDIAWEDPAESFRRVEPLARAAVEQGARLLVLPEMFATGFSMNVPALAAAAPEIEAWVRALAYDLQLTVVAGIAAGLPDDARGCNLALAFDPDGQPLARYQKIHPFTFGGEHRHFAGGQALSRLEVEGVRITPFICYDLRFPEIFRAAADRSDLMLVIANWPRARRHAWRTLLMARAIENQVYVLGVNRVGEGGGLEYVGDSMLIDPLGEPIAEAPEGPGLVAGDVSPARVVEVRERFSFLRDRQPEVYRKL
jgi:predicted amidohydrolase